MLPVCTGVFRRTLGLTCAYDLEESVRLGSALEIGSIHPYWLLDCLERISWPPPGPEIQGVDPVLRVRNPAIVRSRGMPAGTTRNWSHFELSIT